MKGFKVLQHFVLDPGGEKEALEMIKGATGEKLMSKYRTIF